MKNATETWKMFTPSTGGDPQCGTRIGAAYYTLFYDYDEMRDGKLWASTTTDDTRIDWLRKRVNGVVVEPLSRLIAPGSAAFLEVNSEFKKTDAQGTYMKGIWRTFTASAFMVTLTAIDALGLFVPQHGLTNPPPWRQSGPRFRNFIAVLLPQWNATIAFQRLGLRPDCLQVMKRSQGKLANILWTEFRCGYAHVFRSHGVGYDIYMNDRWEIADGILEVNPVAFFHDFQKAVAQLFHMAHADPRFRAFFLRAFEQVYPPRT